MNNTPDLMLMVINIGKIIPQFIMLVQGTAGLTGLFFIGTSLLDFWLANSPGTEKHFAGSRTATNMGASTKLFVGGLFMSFATLQLVGIMSRSITGDYVNSRALSYSAGGSSMEEQAQLATLALLSIMQAVGACAFFRCLLTLNARGNGQQNAGLSKVALWGIGAILAWNFKWFSDSVNNWVGFNVIALFTPWS
ncbi:type IV secretion protein DotIE [Acerihabitans sp. TG2]|uniref:type IV secretion protein DotIE n=1 Tax=Acerihabitans sp. TG2 TaxID=3096008 RepID=UPI002B22F11C|nr:type IV secretion protein DotIE [Acerihabitans sp. TG2]MEA9392220.1 type IV secretion protein DotIE [Acerihabitans sp. TG2]